MTTNPRSLTTDGRLLFATRLVRLFAYGFLSVVLALYLAQVGLTTTQIGLLFTLTLIGDAGVSLWITTSADRIGRKRMLLLGAGHTPLASHRAIVIGYALIGLALAALFARLSPVIKVSGAAPTTRASFGLHHSRSIALKLSALFAMDAFAGGLVVQSLAAYWFHTRLGVPPAVLGSIFFGANILAGVSALLAARVAARIGLVQTMVFTHIPSNVLLMLVPLMPSLPLAVALLLARFSISQMDVPTRQSYTMAVVEPDERSAASGVTTIARSIGSAISPSLAGMLISASLLSLPFLLAGGIKIVYDLTLYLNFRAMKPPEERATRV